jgi:large subunit ribosomal protein L22
MSAYKARQVLDLVRGMDVDRARETLEATPREAARVVAKVLASAVANARNNEQLDPEDLYVSACFADEGTTLKRWRPRARGRATRIRKRTCHITVIVSRLPDERLERRRARRAEETTAMRSRRVAASRRGGGAEQASGATADGAVSEVEELEAVGDDDTEAGLEGDEVLEAGADEAEGEADLDEAEVDEVAAEVEVDEVEAEPAVAAPRKGTKKATAEDAEGDDERAGEEEKG